MKEFEELK